MKLPVIIDRRYHDAVLFDLDGVVADTAAIHAKAWARVVNEFLAGRPTHQRENHSPFTDDDYRQFLDGNSPYDGMTNFLASRGIALDRASPADAAEANRAYALSDREEDLFRQLLAEGVATIDSTIALVRRLHSRNKS